MNLRGIARTVDVRRMVDAAPAILQVTVTAVASYAFASFVLGHERPLIAALVVISSLGFVRDARPIRVLETVVGMTLGIALAEVLLIVAGQGIPQYALALAVTLLVARLVSPSAAFAVAAALQCTLVMLMPLPEGGPFTRTVDGLVAGAFALVATAIIPRDPRRTAAREGRRLVHEHVAVLGAFADALRHGDADAAELALSRARSTQPVVDAWTAAVDSGVAIARISPFGRRSRYDLDRQRTMLTGLELATRNLRVVARRTAFAERDGARRPGLAELFARTAAAVGILADAMGDVEHVVVARQSAIEIAKHLDPERIVPDSGAVAERNVVHALRPYLVDVLVATGLDIAAARDALAPL
ncbi:FUSC family protein [Agromyces sp. SYSU T00194]|uniref:FUSC family protein n=1 Tax=Agromyces chitinivorans TaxID=3158560 RepID=UPI0033921C39